MYKKLVLLLLSLTLSGTLFSQSVIDITLDENVNLFIDGDIILNIHPTSEDKVKIKGLLTNDAFNQLSVREKDGFVVIKRKQPVSLKNYGRDSVILNISIKSLQEVNANSNAEIIFKDFFVLDDITLKASNNASISAMILTDLLNIESKSRSKILARGEAVRLNMDVSNGYANTIQVKCKKAKVSASVNGECYVTANEVLDLSAVTAGNIFYKGVAEEVIKSQNTFGNIEKF